ncbi:Rv3654c family TadE-like protein [Nocardia sp. CDC160]|uniref:Rv3654c family TadE-like protein n=1 Tax=Nocardia sp. CDC160 TaxID=3112166 RepID=UPI002DB9DF42|nr:Rv3654c family TadE-like protein [Nocardia sp. CDC160]MEC3913809.1 Rv3654c family TadE-like protein [Nocardia sp. CDC160]
MRPTGRDRRDGEAGAVTVTACLALIGVLTSMVLIAQIGVAVAARHRVQAAADLGALAAAGALDGGSAAACARAVEVVDRMGARSAGCVVRGWDVTVTAEGRISLGPLGRREVRAAARAGPAEGEG